MTAPVDVLAVLRPYAQDTGAFRVSNKGATELAEACAAVAELMELTAKLVQVYNHKPTRAETDAIRAALARCGGAA